MDSNVWLEPLLEQEQASDAKAFIEALPKDELAMTDFSLFSIGIRLLRSDRTEAYRSFLADLFGPGGVRVIRLQPGDVARVAQLASRSPLDFDDAYQCIAAEEHHLTIVSFDKDFDRTERGRQTPAQALASLEKD